MKVVALATLAVVAATFVTACGSAHRRVVRWFDPSRAHYEFRLVVSKGKSS